ncbi:MAG: sarcosine oxidase subunit alpha, partial [Gammaproteobacteria bacterium]|nr:sarcosine oxidase subunit alpha [Gammaproteobacteria bacterium]
VVLAEQDSLAGGALLARRMDDTLEPWRTRALAALAGLSNVELLTRTTALGLYDGNTVALLERRDQSLPRPERGQAREVVITLRARAIVFATGALERPLLFADNDRPGVMLASAARTYLNRYAVRCGARVVVTTNNDGAWATAFDLAAAGSHVTVIDQRATADDALREQARRAGVTVQAGASVIRALGARRVTGAIVASVDAGAGNGRRVDCDLLCMSGGWAPTLHLTSHTGIRPVYDAGVDAFVPGGYAAGQFGAGALAGLATTAEAVASGIEAGLEASQHAGRSGPDPALPELRALPDEGVADRRYQQAQALIPGAGRGKVFVDFQMDVTSADLQLAQQEGFESVEHLKRYTTLGMGTDQGKTGGLNAVRLMAGLRGIGMDAAGTTTFRPPYTPVSIGALAGRNIGHHFRPVRRSPMHDWHLANGAVMIEAGPWLRPLYYQWAGADVESAARREMQLVRGGVGISDVSTLGKIDVQGPDAAAFLDRVYVNGFARLAVGKARYGVMLCDEASVLDDGTTTRLSPTRYFMTTTTAQAAEVMSWLEFLLQTAWTDLGVQVLSLTDEWAGMSIAGPRSRAALELALPGHDLSDAAIPHMGCKELTFEGVPLRILRLSFSGELAYEVYTPAGYGTALWAHLLERAQSLGIRPYGLEALASLRIEKGHVAGLELDHRNTLDDLGLGRMASKDKPYVGRELRARPALQAPERWSLVGIECLEPGKRLRGGAILFARDEPLAGHGRGYITSVTWSAETDQYIALGLYQGGLRHEGQEILCAFPLKHEQVRARIVSPVFLDPSGKRLHA